MGGGGRGSQKPGLGSTPALCGPPMLKLELWTDKVNDEGMLGGGANVVAVFMSHGMLGGMC